MMTGDGLLSCGVGQRLSGVLIRGELAIGAQLRAAKLHMRVVGVKRALGPALSFFFKLRSTAHRCRPLELWATHCRPSAAAITGLLAPYTVGGQRTRFPI